MGENKSIDNKHRRHAYCAVFCDVFMAITQNRLTRLKPETLVDIRGVTYYLEINH